MGKQSSNFKDRRDLPGRPHGSAQECCTAGPTTALQAGRATRSRSAKTPRCRVARRKTRPWARTSRQTHAGAEGPQQHETDSVAEDKKLQYLHLIVCRCSESRKLLRLHL